MRKVTLSGFVLGSLICTAMTSHAATLFVDPTAGACTGNYSIASRNCTGSDGNSYATSAAGVAAASAGDTVYYRSGTYSGVIAVSGKAGTVGNHITFAGYPGETVTFQTPTSSRAVTGLEGASFGQYLTFRHLIFDGVNQTCTTAVWGFQTAFAMKDGAHHIVLDDIEVKNTCGHAVYIGSDNNPPAGFEIRNSKFHDLRGIDAPGWRTLGLYLHDSIGVLVENNQVYNVPGGGGQFYPGPNTNAIFRKNVFYGNGSFSSTNIGGFEFSYGLGTGSQIYNNLVYENFKSGFQVYQTSGWKFWNNTIVGNTWWGIDIQTGAGTGIEAKNNIVFGNGSGQIQNTTTGAVVSNNVTTTPGFANAAADDYTLASGSAAINACVNIGFPYNGSSQDCGAFESVPFAGATIDTTFLDVTLGMSLNTPLLPASGITGFSVGCSGSNCGTPVVASATRLAGSDSIVRLQLSGLGGGGVCEAGQTWTVTYAPGNVTDSALIGGTLNQSVFAFASQPVSNNCGGTPPSPPSGPHIVYPYTDGSGTTVSDTSGNALHGTTTGSPTWGTGSLTFTDQVDDYVSVPYGNGVNPSTQSLTWCHLIEPLSTSNTRTFFGAPLGTSQSAYLSIVTGTWAMGIQGSPAASNADFSVQTGASLVCIEWNASTDTATLIVNKVRGTGAQSVKAYTSYSLAGDFVIGKGNGFGSSVSPGGTISHSVLYLSVLTAQQMSDLYDSLFNPSPPSTGTFQQKGHRFQRLRKKADGSAEFNGSLNASIEVVQNGAVILVTQTDCTVADCDPINQRLRYSIDGGPFNPLPDTLGGDQVAYFGTTTDSNIVSGAVVCCLTGALTAVDGTTVFVSDAIPQYDLPQNGSVVQRRVIRIGTPPVGSQICFKEYHQDGNLYNGGYDPSSGACITVIGQTGNM